MTTPRSPAKEDRAPRRILDAAIRVLVREGAAEASLARIAEEAQVSKALVHYHFHDREQLLASVVARLGARLRERERAAVTAGTGEQAVDVLWGWLDDEIQRGELRTVLELGLERRALIREAAAAVARQRRADAATTVDTTFRRLGLRMRVGPELVAEGWVTFVDGIVLDAGALGAGRIAFDVHWLAVLGLAD